MIENPRFAIKKSIESVQAPKIALDQGVVLKNKNIYCDL